VIDEDVVDLPGTTTAERRQLDARRCAGTDFDSVVVEARAATVGR
jgi:hypothetical protein